MQPLTDAVIAHTIETPLGLARLLIEEDAITKLQWLDGSCSTQTPLSGENTHPLCRDATQQLHEYFKGQRRTFDLPLNPRGTPFQHGVWQQLRQLGFGQSSHYGDVAKAIGRAQSVRAVAGAIARNPVAVFIPCHRVLGAKGTLTGFRWGLDKKAALLDLEAIAYRG